MIYIGIDPAFRTKGFCIAIFDTTDRTVNFKTFKRFGNFVGWLINDRPETAVVCIENSNLQQYTFNKAHNPLNIGKNMGISQCTVELCTEYYPKTTYQISPKEKGEKITPKIAQSIANINKHKTTTTITTQDQSDAYKILLIGINKHQQKT